MQNGKYLYWFPFPNDWVNEHDHEIIELVFIIAASTEAALSWGNSIAEKFIEDLFTKNDYHQRKIGYTNLIYYGPDHEFSESEREEIKEFPIVNYGEYPVWSFASEQ